MKDPRTVSIVVGFLLLAGLRAGPPVVLQAQAQVSQAPAAQWQAVPSELVPKFGTFFSLQNTNFAPLPFNPWPLLPAQLHW